MPESDATLETMMMKLLAPGTQERLQERQQKLQDNLTSSIGQAAEVLGATEAKLRNWEQQGAFIPSQPRSTATTQRRYSLADLKKLLVISELLDQDFSLGQIAFFMRTRYAEFEQALSQASAPAPLPPLNISERITQADQDSFWRFFLPHACYLTISLIFEAPPSGDVGVFLPLRDPVGLASVPQITSPAESASLGTTLVGWKERDHPLYTFFCQHGATLDHPDLYSLLRLDALAPASPATGAYLIAKHDLIHELSDRDRQGQLLTRLAIKTVKRLVRLLVDTSPQWRPIAAKGAEYMPYAVYDFTAPTSSGAPVLNKLAEIVVRAGGTAATGTSIPWRFACIVLPNNPSAPMHQRALAVQARAGESPYKVGTVFRSDIQETLGLSQRAFFTGNIVYRAEMTPEDPAVVGRDLEEPIGSAIAVPIAGDEGHALGVLYVTSAEPGAFSEDDQRFLRVMSKMVGEVIQIYQARRLPTDILRRMLIKPLLVEPLLEVFFPEGAFISRLEGLLEKLHAGERPVEQLSFIAIDVDLHTGIERKFGEWAARNLIWQVGHDITELFRVNSRTPGDLPLYRVYSDRFYIVMEDTSLEATRAFAQRLKQGLTHPYRIPSAYGSSDARDDKIMLDRVTLRLGITSYTADLLKSLLSLAHTPAVPTVRAQLTRALDQALRDGKDQGGNVIISWNPQSSTFIKWPPSPASDPPHSRG